MGERLVGQIVHMRKVSKKIFFVDILVSRDQAEKGSSDQVEAEKVSSNQVEAEKVSSNQVEAEKVSSNQVEAEKVSSNQVEAEKVSSDQVEAEKVRQTLIFKFWEVPDLQERCVRGPDKLHVGDTIECVGTWDTGVLSVQHFYIQVQWKSVSQGRTFTPVPPQVSGPTNPGNDSLCKFFLNTGKCEVSNCKYKHAADSIKESRLAYVQEKMARRRMVHEDQFHKDELSSASKRAEIFASWIREVYGEEYLRGGVILDVAGGRGDLSFELAVKCGLRCEVVDPRPRKLKRWQASLLKKVGEQRLPVHHKEFFDEKFLEKEVVNLSQIKLITGMHPDEATETILDTALLHNIPTAVVPCCVFSALSPARRLRTGETPTSYQQFCTYLQEKNDSIKTVSLPFVGRNLVLYTRPSAFM